MDDEELARRLEMFEAQLEKMAEAVITLARIEERQLSHNREITQLHTNQKEISNEAFKRLRSIEAKLTINTTKMGTGERFWWILITALVATLVSILTIKTFGS